MERNEHIDNLRKKALGLPLLLGVYDCLKRRGLLFVT